jgi:hypothetical protein
MMAT